MTEINEDKKEGSGSTPSPELEIDQHPDPIIRHFMLYTQPYTVWELGSQYNRLTFYFSTQRKAVDFLRKQFKKIKSSRELRLIPGNPAGIEKVLADLVETGSCGLKIKLTYRGMVSPEMKMIYRNYWLKEISLDQKHPETNLTELGF